MTENHGVASSILALGILGQTQADNAGMVQLVEHLLAKEKVTGSSPVARSIFHSWLIANGTSTLFAVSLIIMATWPSWKGKGLQNPDHGFESRRRLYL